MTVWRHVIQLCQGYEQVFPQVFRLGQEDVFAGFRSSSKCSGLHLVIPGGQPADKRLFFKPVEEPPAHYYAQFGMNQSLHYEITVFRCSTTHSAWPYFKLFTHYLIMGCVTICVNFCKKNTKTFLYKIYFIGGDLNEYEKHFGAVFYCQ